MRTLKDIKDLELYSKTFLKIKDKKGNLVPLTYNRNQKELTEIVKQHKEKNLPIRIIALKGRQVTASTWGTSFLYHETSLSEFIRSVIIGDDTENTNNLFNMCELYYDESAEEIKPMKKYSNRKELVFENPTLDEAQRIANPGLRSSITAMTAGKATAGRSGTIQKLLCTEFAFWPNASEVRTGLFQAVPYEPGTFIFIDSTANGVSGKGGEFYKMWNDAVAGRSKFIPIFFPWHQTDEYELDYNGDLDLGDNQVRYGDELFYYDELVNLYGQDRAMKKMAWRRYKIDNDMGSATLTPLDQFKQEYPFTPEEAFLASGRPVFPQEKLKRDISRASKISFKQGHFNEKGEFYEDMSGPYKIFQPKTDEGYSIGADVAEGVIEGDYSTMFCINKRLKQIMSYFAHINPSDFGREVVKAGKYYNNALLAPELNNHGHAVYGKIKDLDYTNVYTRMVKDEHSEAYTKKIGWVTNAATKMKMLDDFVDAYRNDLIEINDVELLREMATVTTEEDGKVILTGKDRVVGACIALQSVGQIPHSEFKAYVPEKQNPHPKTLQERLKRLEKEKHETYFE